MITTGSQLLLPGSLRPLTVRRFIGEGSQGAVFEADDGVQPLALKWYFPHTGTAHQRGAIAELIERGTPSRRFLWPQQLVDARGEPGFGYTMPLRPDRYAGLVDLLTGKVDAPFSTICRLCIDLADSFLQLHSQGLCYRDISFGNVFFHPVSGVPLICDNDNVGIDGRGPVAVLGTRRFMAPEIVRREASPSSQTDLYSLAVVLFYVLMMGHPLVGRRELDIPCWDEQAESLLFGQRPLFVFDPEDASNAPVPELHDALLRLWELYPLFVRDLFTQAFTIGLHDPVNGRVRESVWRSALARLRDRIVRCVTCDKENFAPAADTAATCWSCSAPVSVELWAHLPGRAVALGNGSMLFGHHLRHDYDYDTVVAEVTRHPSRPDLLGLTNRTESEWNADLPGGERRGVPPGRSVRLAPETVVAIGGTKLAISFAAG
jgi:serine/threonine protein kinase